MSLRKSCSANTFQSTLSVRRATWAGKRADAQGHISIHALREESDLARRIGLRGAGGISIHALREESDQADETLDQHSGISIHALREESDVLYMIQFLYSKDFNPRSP